MFRSLFNTLVAIISLSTTMSYGFDNIAIASENLTDEIAGLDDKGGLIIVVQECTIFILYPNNTCNSVDPYFGRQKKEVTLYLNEFYVGAPEESVLAPDATLRFSPYSTTKSAIEQSYMAVDDLIASDLNMPEADRLKLIAETSILALDEGGIESRTTTKACFGASYASAPATFETTIAFQSVEDKSRAAAIIDKYSKRYCAQR